MPRNITVTFDDGSSHVYQNAPDNVTPQDVEARASKEFGKKVTGLDGGRKAAPAPQAEEPGMVASIAAGLGKGVGSTALGAQKLIGQGLDKLGGLGSSASITDLIVKPKGNIVQRAGRWLVEDADSGRKKLEGELAPYKEANPLSAGAGELGGEIAATLPVGGVLAKVAQGVGAAPTVVRALQTSGMTTGAKVAPGFVPAVKNLAVRSAAGAATGGASGMLVDQDSAGTAAAVSGAMPLAGKLASKAGSTVAGVVKPFFNAGQEDIAGRALREFAENPDAALAALKGAKEVIPGSAPTAVTASGDIGLAGLNRTLQNTDPAFAAEAARRAASQNAARTSAMEAVAGNTGKLQIAKDARDAATGAIREAVLDAAGGIDANRIVGSLESMLRRPANAGRLSQQALSGIKNQIEGATQNGVIDSRALYAIRKDINDILGGKLQGEAGNLKYASGQLIDVKTMIDNAIDQASRRVTPSNGTAVALNSGAMARPGMAAPGMGPRPTWRQYLDEYTKHSIPINQMEMLEGVLSRAQTGTVDAGGNAVLSAAKLNNILKNEGRDLMKTLSPEQLQLVRNLAADLNAQQLGNTAGKAIGSNTVQNIASANILRTALGNKLGGSALAENTAGRAIDWVYKRANEGVREKLNAAMLDPKEAARLLEAPELGSFAKALQAGSKAGNATGINQIPYRAAPLLAGQN